MKHKGERIREVHDFRLSVASVGLKNSGATWTVGFYCNKTGEILGEEHDSGVPTVVGGIRNNHDCKAIAICYDWVRVERDKYSLSHIELRKPVVAMINAANEKAVEINGEMATAVNAGKNDLANQKRGELSQHSKAANKLIVIATNKLKTSLKMQSDDVTKNSDGSVDVVVRKVGK